MFQQDTCTEHAMCDLFYDLSCMQPWNAHSLLQRKLLTCCQSINSLQQNQWDYDFGKGSYPGLKNLDFIFSFPHSSLSMENTQ